MTKYRKKPVEVEARQFVTMQDATVIINWILRNGGTARFREAQPFIPGPQGQPAEPDHIAIDTLEGTMYATLGYYIIRGVRGEFYPCQPDIFEQTYDPIEQTPEGSGR